MSSADWPLLPREHYLEKMRAVKDAPFIKAIIGLRRSGKSKLMELFMDELTSSGVDDEHILAINFELEDDWIPKDHESLNSFVASKVKIGKGTYIFFDEIQNVDGWESSVRSLYDKGCDIYVTGSNSKLLSSELATKLSGRTVEVHMAPLVFSEYVMFRKDSGLSTERLFSDYIRHGGLPAVALSEDNRSAALIPEMLAGVYSTVFLKDVVERHNIRNPASLSNLMRFVMSNIGDRTSSRKAANYMTSAGSKISHVTVDEYLDYLNEAFLALRSKRMDSKTSEYLSTSDKFYAQDLGIRNHVTPYRPEDIDGLLENVVYNELVYRFGEVCTYSVNDMEVDFLADPKNRPKYFQVCTSIADPKTLEREIRPFRELKDNYPKTLIIYERYPLDEIEGVRVVNLFDWLLE